MSAFHHNSIEKKTAELMWRNYCAKPLHEVPSAQEIEQTMQRPLNCEWALAKKDMDLVEQSLVDSNVQPLFHFSRLHLKRPWLAIAIMTITAAIKVFIQMPSSCVCSCLVFSDAPVDRGSSSS